MWPAVSPQAPGWGVALGDEDPRDGGRDDEALAGAGGVQHDLWGTGHTTLMVYARGGDAMATLRALAHAGVQERGMQPTDQGTWGVAEAVRVTVRSKRGQTAGSMETLKTDQDGFNKPTERLWQTLEMAGPRSLLSDNLNKCMRDLVRVDR